MPRYIIEMLYETPRGLSAREFACAAPDHESAVRAALARASGLPDFGQLVGGAVTEMQSEPELTSARRAVR